MKSVQIKSESIFSFTIDGKIDQSTIRELKRVKVEIPDEIALKFLLLFLNLEQIKIS
jgi:hypothetical protein